MSLEKPPFLHLVKSPSGSNFVRAHKRHERREYWQPMLFPELDANFVETLILERVSKNRFYEAIIGGIPKYIVDLRVAPRFDYYGLNRTSMFKIFELNGHKYYDYAGSMGISNLEDAKLNPALLVGYIRNKALHGANALGAIILIFDPSYPKEREYTGLVADYMSSTSEKWKAIF